MITNAYSWHVGGSERYVATWTQWMSKHTVKGKNKPGGNHWRKMPPSKGKSNIWHVEFFLNSRRGYHCVTQKNCPVPKFLKIMYRISWKMHYRPTIDQDMGKPAFQGNFWVIFPRPEPNKKQNCIYTLFGSEYLYKTNYVGLDGGLDPMDEILSPFVIEPKIYRQGKTDVCLSGGRPGSRQIMVSIWFRSSALWSLVGQNEDDLVMKCSYDLFSSHKFLFKNAEKYRFDTLILS